MLGQGGITYPLAFREEQLGREDLSSDEGEPTPSTPSSGDDVARALATGIAHNFDRPVVHSDASSSPGDVTNPNNQPRREIIDVSPEYSNRQSSAAPAPAPDPGGRRPAWPKWWPRAARAGLLAWRQWLSSRRPQPSQPH